MSFLPEEDQEFLADNAIEHRELTERMPDGTVRRGILFAGFRFSGALWRSDGALVSADRCDLLILVPDGYATAKLDSFYTDPKLRRSDGSFPQNANGDTSLFQQTWQFWSRHLGDGDWRVGVDGLRTFLSYIRGELKAA